MELDAEIFAIFAREAEEHLQVLEDPAASAAARRRASHGLRGAAAMVGLHELASGARELEQAASLADAAVWEQTVRGLRQQLDGLQRAADRPSGPPGPAPLAAASSITQDFEAEWDPQTAQLLRACFVEEASDHLEAISVAIEQLHGTGAEQALAQILRKVHTLKGSAATVGLSEASAAAHSFEELLQAAQAGRQATASLATEQLLALVEDLRHLVESSGSPPADPGLRPLATPLADPRSPQHAAPASVAPQHAAPASVAPQHAAPVSVAPQQPEDARLRVDVRLLDALMNLVGELVIDRTRVERRVEEFKALIHDLSLSRRTLQLTLADSARWPAAQGLARLHELEGELTAITRDLQRATSTLIEDAGSLRRTSGVMQELLAQVRLMPIRWLHARLQRPLKELAQSQGKRIALVIDDESSGLDRSLAEPVGDALTQLVRNAVAHGIEPPAVRAALGKPETGTIRIAARHQGGHLVIAVHDDGSGIDLTTLRQVLRERGILPAETLASLPEEQLLALLFVPGVSTFGEASQLAGRGMGLDIVRQNITGLGGAVQVSTAAGQGTSFVLELPLTTAIARALLFKVGSQTYALPVGHVEGTDQLESSDLEQDAGQTLARVRGSWVPLVRLEPLLCPETAGASEPGARPAASRLQIIALTYGALRFAVSCSRVIGPREIVLKRIGPLLASVPLLAGATVSGSSKVQFVLDVAYLASLVTAGAAATASPAPPLIGLPAPPRLLVADDSRAVREAVALMLRQAGYEIDLAADGWEAWESLQQQDYQLLLTDLEMPRLHGHELIRRCRKDPRLNALPIVVLTSRSSARSQETALQLGARAFLAKPVNRRLILTQIEALLAASKDPSSR